MNERADVLEKMAPKCGVFEERDSLTFTFYFTTRLSLPFSSVVSFHYKIHTRTYVLDESTSSTSDHCYGARNSRAASFPFAACVTHPGDVIIQRNASIHRFAGHKGEVARRSRNFRHFFGKRKRPRKRFEQGSLNSFSAFKLLKLYGIRLRASRFIYLMFSYAWGCRFK